jgi:hypothetical protein
VDPGFALRGWAVFRQSANSDLSRHQGSVSWAEGGLRKVKHIELKNHFTQHLIQRGYAKVTYVQSEKNCADGLTRPWPDLNSRKFVKDFATIDREAVLMNDVFAIITHKPCKPLQAVDERNF